MLIARAGIKRSHADQMFDIIVFVLMTAFMLLCLYPLYFIIIASISEPNDVLNGRVILLPSGITFDGYARIFRD
jgi:putative aldouronate transport system permease protein